MKNEPSQDDKTPVTSGISPAATRKTRNRHPKRAKIKRGNVPPQVKRGRGDIPYLHPLLPTIVTTTRILRTGGDPKRRVRKARNRHEVKRRRNPRTR